MFVAFHSGLLFRSFGHLQAIKRSHGQTMHNNSSFASFNLSLELDLYEKAKPAWFKIHFIPDFTYKNDQKNTVTSIINEIFIET